MHPVFRSLAVLVLLGGVQRLPAQQITLMGLKSSHNAGAFHGLRQDSAGSLYTLFDAQDGVHLLKFNAAGTQMLGEAVLGQNGDTGVALDLDPKGNIYVAGTSSSLGNVTGTAGAAFPNRAGTRTNSFVASFSPALQQRWLTFCGAEPLAVTSIAATANSVLVTGSIFSATLPVTANGIQQSPAPNSGSNGFVESFSPLNGTLQYATYLTGANGDTTPTTISADAAGDAYVAGTTTATGYPTTAALSPTFRSVDGTNASGFVSKLTPSGDGFLFSTFVPGNGLTSAAYDSTGSGSLLLSGDVEPGLFPLTQVQVPVAPLLRYQTAMRLLADGSSVMWSTLLAPGTASIIAPGLTGSAWVFGSSQNTAVVPLLPVLPVESAGNAFALRVTPSGSVDRASRFGGLSVTNGGYASLPAMEGGIAVLPDGTVAVSGTVAPTLSSDLLATQFYDLPLAFAPNAALPSTVRDALPASDCNGSACSGSAGLLAKLSPDASAPTLALSSDDLPDLTLRNLGTATAKDLQISSQGFAVNSNCAASLPAGGGCSVALTGTGPGSITVQASNATAFTTPLGSATRTPGSIAVLPRELDFGIVTATSAPVTRTLTVANLGTDTETFASANSSNVQSAYTLTETSSTCTPASPASMKMLAPGGSCTVTLSLGAARGTSNDGAINARWRVGTADVLLTGYLQSASLSLSANRVDFGRQFTGGLRSRRYLYLSNSSDTTVAHAAVASTNSAFIVTDECPAVLQPRAVCRIALSYEAASAPSSDALTLNVDGLQATVLGETLPQPSATGTVSNPNLRVSVTSVSFSTPVAVTQASSESHPVTVSNAGTLPFTLTLATSGDFAYATSCPAMLNGGASCTVVLTFTPAAGGTRQGLLSVTAGSASPTYVALSGSGMGILPAGSDSLLFGDVPLNTPAVRWLKVSQSFPTLTVTSSDASFAVLLVEDTGYGHGEPSAGAFGATASASCLNCYLGVQFLTQSASAHSATVSLLSPGGGRPATVAVSGQGIPLTGLILAPVNQDFGTVPVQSSSASTNFILTNGTASSITASGSTVTGDFSVTTEETGAATCTSGTIAPGAACIVPVRFSPSGSGTRTGKLSVTTSAGQVSSMLTGIGSDDPGVSFSPGELRFDNVPGGSAGQQSIRVRNTSGTSITLGTPTVDDTHFAVVGTCGVLAPAAGCDLTVSYTAGSFLADGMLLIPVTTAPAGAPSTTQYAVALAGQYTSDTAGLQIVPGEHATVNFGAAATRLPALQRVLHVNNLLSQPLTITVESPTQFAVLASTCDTLPANSACDLTVQYTPLTAGNTTGTVLLRGTSADGSSTQSTLGYLQGYGTANNGSLIITGDISPAGVLSFGQLASGQAAARTLTITNPVSSMAGTALTVYRIRSEFPYRSTSTCGEALAPGQSCSVTITYSPIFQAAVGSGQTATQTNTGVLTIESDGGTAPQFIDLAGSVTPAFVTAPENSSPIAAFSTSQGSLTFTSRAVGTASATQTVTLVNTGTATIHVEGVVTSNSFRASSACATLVVDASCDITVQYVPQSGATALGSLEIRSDSSASLEFVSLLGSLFTPQAPAQSITLTPQSLDFGRVRVGRTASLLATVVNTGTEPVILAERSVSGNSGFTLADSNSVTPCPPAGATLAAGTSCTLATNFTPAAVGTLRGTLSLSSSATSLPLMAALSGVGTQPQLAVSPGSLSFGNVVVGSVATQAITLINASALPAEGLRFSVSAGFSVSSTCGITTINAASSCAVNVTFAPSNAGVTSGLLTITSSDPASPLLVPLTGTGALQSQLSLAPGSLDFGNLPVGTTGTLTSTLRNTSNTSVTSISITATAGFAVTTGCGTSLAPGSSCPVTVAFAPSIAGVQTGLLMVNSLDSASPLTASLAGTGTVAGSADGSFTLTVNGSTTSGATVQTGLPASFSLVVTPVGGFTGTVALTCAADTPVTYAACSLVPSSLVMAAAAQNSTVTISTVSAVSLSASAAPQQRIQILWCLTPALLVLLLRRKRPSTLLTLLIGLLAFTGGCGSGGDPRIRYVTPGSYTFRVTAASTSGTKISQTVALKLTVTPR